MALTYTTAADRDARGVAAARWRAGTLDVTLGAASLLAVVLMFSAYRGAVRPERSGDSTAVQVVNLNTVMDGAALEPVLEGILPIAGDRRLAAHSLFAFLVQTDGGRRSLRNVGAVGRARIPATAIDGTPGVSALRRRLSEERARAAQAGTPAPESIALLTSLQLAEVKPRLIVRDRAEVRQALLFWGALYLLAIHAVSMVWRARGMKGDRVLLTAAHVLTAIGMAAMISRPDPLRDVLLFIRYAEGVVAGLVVAAAVSMVNVRTSNLRNLSYVPLAGAVTLSLLLLLFGSGPAGSNAVVNLGPVQPIEAIRVLLSLFLAGYFARHWELLRAVRGERVGSVRLPAWANLPRARYVVPVVAGVGGALLLFFVQKDLGPALMLAVVFLAAYGIARGTTGLAIGGVVLLGAGFYLGYRLEISTTLAERVRMWQAPWDNTARGGDQIAQSVWSLSSGGLLGTGPGFGDTRYLPAGHTDLVLSALGEEFGFVGLIAVALVYAAMIARALSTAKKASTDYAFFLSIVLALFLAVPVLLMASGLLGLVPLTGVVTPFLSFGGSAMLANFAALGLLAAIRSDPAAPADLDAFRKPVRWLAGGLAVAAAALAVVAFRVQVVRADEFVVKPHLGLQADEMRRFQYNPRVLDLARSIPRGTIADRQGLPLATDDRQRLKALAPDYLKLGIDVDRACPDPAERCYPLGGRAFHLLGDAATRTNWSASNTSFVERDSEARLRGFDSHETSIAVTKRDGTPSWALRRDYRDLVPLLRHRNDPGHPAVKAAMDQRRELRLTIDARLQVRVAAIIADYARRSATGRAAAIVLDPATGAVLASVSYPWPVARERGSQEPDGEDDEDLLDRARYGQYPPGSTFKLVTAAAALRRDPRAASRTFTCSRLPDGRVGARVAGYGRPVRDDVLDRQPHGTIDMHQALVVSCNAYFAQLAVQIGPGVITDAAERAEIPLARNNAGGRIRDTLPQIGYGQGDVLTSPLRMARIAAAIAAEGGLRDARIEPWPGSPPAPHGFMAPELAQALGRDMRAAVLDGTGRSVRGSATPIAGKTGTAEVTGAPSHSWFVGFAPHGPATRRIAVAVILENAGYGGAGAAPAAGEIVAAAAAVGLVR